MRGRFVHELEALINKHSIDNELNTPDFILASFLNDCLNNFNVATKRHEEWRRRRQFEDEDVGGVCK